MRGMEFKNMVNIILSGANGKMGRAVAALVKGRADCQIVAGIDAVTQAYDAFPIYASPQECEAGAPAVLIDFSHPSLLTPLLAFAKARGIAVVLATTGYCAQQKEEIREASGEIPVFFSANMSLGVNLLAHLCKRAAAVLGGDFDIEIIEKHHNQKVDAPSGTALLLADAMCEALPQPPQYVYDRHSQRRRRGRDEIGIHSVRGGAIVGEHEVLFAGANEVLSLKHAASSREVFASGAVSAALYLSGKGAGMYDMGHLAEEQEEAYVRRR